MKLIARDTDDRLDVPGGLVFGGLLVLTALVMRLSNIGDTMLQVFFAISGAIPLVLSLTLRPRA